jgi:alkylation response protein AidB-like acyl-CoA dehydrogenase
MWSRRISWELTTEEQRARWLPGFCRGELVSAIGVTEPDAGSDLAALRTTATRDADGWVIDGAKTFITNGANADLVIVAARTGRARREISLFVVEAGTPGFTRGQPLQKVGQPEADTAELFFEGVRVPNESLIGAPGQGFAHMMIDCPRSD